MSSSMIRNLKMRLLPPSSRSFHERSDRIYEHQDIANNQLFELAHTTEDASHRAEERLNALGVQLSELNQRFNELSGKIDRLSSKLATLEAHHNLQFDALYRNTEHGESPFESRCRLFSQLPDATGDTYIMQRATAKLMNALDSICCKLDIPYWISYGTLIGAYTRHDFIPWDDDIDICMFRHDIKRLTDELANDETYKVTTVYDRYVLCKQYRFTTRDDSNPCFIDLGAWDWATSFSQDNESTIRQLRLDLMRDLENEMPAYWNERPYLFHPSGGFVAQCSDVSIEDQDAELALQTIDVIDDIFSRYQAKAYELGILTEESNSKGVAYGLDNLLAVADRQVILPTQYVFPLQSIAFDRYQFKAPANPKSVLDLYFQNWPYLPQDILGHDHFSKALLRDDKTRNALIRYLASD